jgi:hypothetical protein
MINPFKLRGPFGADYSVDGDDILRTKKALHQLGHFDEKAFVNPYADTRMIDGLKSFQRSRGLTPDGVMKPDGPTAKALGDALDRGRDRRGFVAGEKPWPRPRHVISAFPTERWRRPDLLDTRREKRDGLGTVDETGSDAVKKPEGIQVASSVLQSGIGDLAVEGAKRVGQGAAGNIAKQALPFVLLQKHLRQLRKKNQDGLLSCPVPPRSQSRHTLTGSIMSSPSARTDIADPVPRVPPWKVEKIDLPTKTQSPSVPPLGAPTEIYPVPEEREALLEGFPDQSDELLQQLIVENRRGNPDTQLDNDYAIKAYNERVERWGLDGRHIKGGHSPDGTYQPERYLSPSDEIGAAWTDASFLFDEGKPSQRIEDIQTTDMLKDGKTMTARERRNDKKVLSLKDVHGEKGGVLNLPKSKGRERKEWESEIDALMDYHFWKRYGPPPNAK